MTVTVEHVPAEATPNTAQPGDFILCHRPGLVPACIGLGERIRYGKGYWSHAAYCISATEIVEALTRGVVRSPLSNYEPVAYVLVHTDLDAHDAQQANAFALSCVGKRYGFVTDFGIAFRFLTPGRGLWFGMNGTEMCSGLVAQAESRGPMIFDIDPGCISPTELGIAYGVAR